MKQILSVFFFLLSIFSMAQDQEICKCEALKKAKDSLNNPYSYNYKTTRKQALTRPFKFVSIQYLKKFSKSESLIDSLETKMASAESSATPDSLLGHYKLRDSIRNIEFAKQYGNIPWPLIVKTGQFNNIIAILYQNDSSFNAKYYLRISVDNGKTWKNYYTGMEKNNNYFFKNNSQFPLWKDRHHLQIEADIVRMTRPLTFPHGEAEYEILRRNALVIININEIMKDSDDDGLNDLEEKMELFTDPLSKDTDSDGVPDSEDNNPKYKTIDNDFTKVLLAALYGEYDLIDNPDPLTIEFIVNLKTFKEDFASQMERYNSTSNNKKSFIDMLQYNVIVTNDENLRRTDTLGKKIIFLTSKEFSKYIQQSFNNIYVHFYSKLFKCDDKKDTYILVHNGVSRGETYVITRIPEGWNIKVINHWMT
ncbi:hypothetical protein [Chryseobacterium sp. T20]|uniref:hypothetical protein n=1 Tax=Chryseobacterium sp. T20 TaxID=3395375 RepID=UPI0039BC92CD